MIEELNNNLNASAGASFSIARESDPRVFVEIFRAFQHRSSLSLKELSDLVAPKIQPLGLTIEPDKAATLERELESLGWIRKEEALLSLTTAGTELLQVGSILNPFAMARRLAIGNEQRNREVVSRMLLRMWDLNPEQQGAVIIPQVRREELPNDIQGIGNLLTLMLPRLMNALALNMVGFKSFEDIEGAIRKILLGLERQWDRQSPSQRLSRLQELVAEQFVSAMFGDILTPSDVQIWQRRLEWAGLTYLGRDLAGVSGVVWFPVGAFRESASADFNQVPEIRKGTESLFLYDPKNIFSSEFVEALFEAYRKRQILERVDYVSIFPVRDWVCYRLRIGAEKFSNLLQIFYSLASRGESMYGLALEVDITPKERQRYRPWVPVIIDETPRYIISMRKRA